MTFADVLHEHIESIIGGVCFCVLMIFVIGKD